MSLATMATKVYYTIYNNQLTFFILQYISMFLLYEHTLDAIPVATPVISERRRKKNGRELII